MTSFLHCPMKHVRFWGLNSLTIPHFFLATGSNPRDLLISIRDFGTWFKILIFNPRSSVTIMSFGMNTQWPPLLSVMIFTSTRLQSHAWPPKLCSLFTCSLCDIPSPASPHLFSSLHFIVPLHLSNNLIKTLTLWKVPFSLGWTNLFGFTLFSFHPRHHSLSL